MIGAIEMLGDRRVRLGAGRQTCARCVRCAAIAAPRAPSGSPATLCRLSAGLYPKRAGGRAQIRGQDAGGPWLRRRKGSAFLGPD